MSVKNYLKPIEGYKVPGWIMEPKTQRIHYDPRLDRKRDFVRSEARARAAMSDDPNLHEALALSKNGFGVEDIMKKVKGVPRDIVVRLVLGRD